MCKCKTCNNEIQNGNMLSCPTCGTIYCTDCAINTKRICPKCYSTLEYIG
ncbi:MAG: hypothetical protein IJR66_03235 [Clostridia bacterium]|nr:hypothetical protein [Clostridia bacterium]MBQ9513974.1 hypothetical protein [Clostridia bacterium]